MKEFVDYCKQYIYDNIDGYRGHRFYPCDLGFTLTEGPNADGTLTYSRAAALDYLKEWVWAAAAYFDYEKENFGEVQHNPFDDAEGYMVCMVVEGVRILVDRALDELGIDGYDMIELDEDLIEAITEKVNEDAIEELF